MTEITIEEAEGKTVKGSAFSVTCPQVVIAFDDDTFTTFGLKCSYDPSEYEIQQSTLDLFNFGDTQLIFLDVFTEKEIEDIHRERSSSFTLQREKEERADYERLKKKFD